MKSGLLVALLFVEAAKALRNSPLNGKRSVFTLQVVPDVLSAPSDAFLNAVDRAPDRRLCASDAAALGGIDLDTAKAELMTLASLTEGNMEVTQDGDIIYSFSPDFRSVLQMRSPALKFRRLWQTVRPPLFTIVRFSFAVALFSSLAIVATAFIAASGGSVSTSNGNRKNRESDRESNQQSSYYRPSSSISINGFNFSPRYFGNYKVPDKLDTSVATKNLSPDQYDILSEFSRDNYAYESYHVSAVESFFSFVFGDGDPNTRFSQAQLFAIASKIRSNGGVVIAEDLAPYLNPPPSVEDGSEDSSIVNESWVLPAVLSFGGVPSVSEKGNIYYTFDNLATSVVQSTSSVKCQPLAPLQLFEQRVPFSRARKAMQLCAGLLGSFNVVGVAWLGVMLRSPGFLQQVGFATALKRLYPGLVTYAAFYALTPIIRAINLSKSNSDIQARNKNRSSWINSKKSNQKRAEVLESAKKNCMLKGGGVLDKKVIFSTKEDKVI